MESGLIIMLQIYDSLKRAKVAFKPINPGKINLYVCGNTVYDDCHLGHARSMVCFDMMVRFLRSQNYEVTYVRNITDIDDKIIKRAQERNISIHELTRQYINSQNQDAASLSIIPPNFEPRATEYIQPIINLIQKLLDTQHAYVAGNGDVCYSVESFDDYGKLSHKDISGLQEGARIDVEESKRCPLDFVLWKMSKPEEPSWESPWGKGRPGWHIECSAMAMDTLGETFDIHGGGGDLQFPHHENEIAQSEAATGKPFANYWLHVGMLQVNFEKMAKSTGNFFTIKSILDQYHPEVVRYFLISSHYRSPLNYTPDNMQNASKALNRLYATLQNFSAALHSQNSDNTQVIDPKWEARFITVMEDDFNTPEALSVLFELCREINKTQSIILASTLLNLANRLGLLLYPIEDFLKQDQRQLDSQMIEKINLLVQQRKLAREAKNWNEADNIRKQLLELGVELDDSSKGTQWRYVGG